MMNNILVISPHPDDDSIGCGGTIRRHIISGDNVHVIYLTSGENGGHGRSINDTIKIREEEAESACRILGISGFEFWREPDGKLKASEKNITHLCQKIENLKPQIIYVTHINEDHPDHQAAAFLLIETLQRSVIPEKLVVWMYEIWTPIQKIDFIVDISEYIEVKIRAVQAHYSQCSVLRFDEAILGLNRYRGEMHSWPGGPYAEVFTAI